MNSLQFLLKYSFRNLLRNRKRSMIMILSLSLGCAYILWILNFANSSSKEIINEFLSQNTGRYVLSHPDFFDQKDKKKFDFYKLMNDKDLPQNILETSTPRILAPVFVSGNTKTVGLMLTGIDVEKELNLSTVKDAVDSGEFLKAQDQNTILLGIRFAKKIQARIGDEVALLGQSVDGSMANELFTVVGLLDFGGGDLEEAMAFTQLHSSQNLLGIPFDQFHQLVSFDMSARALPQFPHLAATNWTELIPEISISMEFIDNFTWIVCVVIVIVLSLGLSNTLIITFLERENEFNTLNIIGAKMKWVCLSLILEILILGTFAIIIGLGLGYAITEIFHYHPINIEVFTGGKPIFLGGMTIKPLVRLHHYWDYYWQVTLLIYLFLLITMIYPLLKVIRRSKNAF